MRDLDRPPSSTSSASSDKYHVRMPGPTPERPRAQRLNDIEQPTSRGLGCGRTEDFGTPVSSGSNMGSVARFPKLDECAHFHYEHVELGALDVSVTEVPNDTSFAVRVTSGDACWTLQRSYENFVMFDKQLHRCIFDRKFSSLEKLPDSQPSIGVSDLLAAYLKRFSQLNHEGLNCGPVLNWLQLDNRGRRILVPESDSCPINTPAVAAAYAVRPYSAQAQDEISFQVGDMISVIDMPPPGESTWWRGKHGFAVGFFPAECVAVIGDKVPRHLTVSTTVRSRLPVKPVLRKHGKLIAFFRSFILNRPSRRRLKQSGILKERVFGCDLGEHLLNSGQDVPAVLACCAEFIENHGLVDGIYRLSGVTSNIQRLRNAFDEDRVPELHSDKGILQDIHSVASLLKMYFRELPNPLCTYQLYSTFVGAVQANGDAERLSRMRDAVRKLPPPHYRTLDYLMRHLVRVAARGAETGMTPRNVAIVWAPNLLRCKELEVGGVAALQGVGVQAVVTEFLICYAELIFGDGPVGRPKSLAITTPARLLSLEEARNRSLRCESDYIEVGAGPSGLPPRYHTVIELPRKRNNSKRSPSLNWRAIFGRGGFGARGKNSRQVGGAPPQADTVPSSLNSLRRLRPVKSADSLDGEDSIGPLLGQPPARPCGHSRSISHDSYFDHLADGPNPASPLLDLSEIQLNFDLEEREMRMFSEEESGGIASVEASPRRQRNEEDQPCIAITGGSKRKRSRLEERLHCEVELRFIDSQSPDQIMVSADIHEMETPSPLPTPGYLPLLSEASTPMTPATMQCTPLSSSPGPSNSPRISFRSFTLPLDLDDSCGSMDEATKRQNTSGFSEKSSGDPSHRLFATPDDRSNINNESCERIETCDDDNNDKRETVASCTDVASCSRNNTNETKNESADGQNQSMMITNDDDEVSSFARGEIIDRRENLGKTLKSDESIANFTEIDEQRCRSDESSRPDRRGKEPSVVVSTNSRNDDIAAGESTMRINEIVCVQSSSNAELDSPMSCEHTLDDLPDSGFVICDSTDKIFACTEIRESTTGTNDSGEWVMIERTTESATTPTCEATSPKEPLDRAVATDSTRLRSTPDNISRISLNLTIGTKIDSDESCIDDSNAETKNSSLSLQSINEIVSYGPSVIGNDRKSNIDEDSNVLPEFNEIFVIDDKKYGSDRRNGNERTGSMITGSSDGNLVCPLMERGNDVSGSYGLDNVKVYRGNMNETNDEKRVPNDDDGNNDDMTMNEESSEQTRKRIITKKQQIGQYIASGEQQQRRVISETRSENQQRYDQCQVQGNNHGFGQSPRKHQSLSHHHHHHHHHHNHHNHHHHNHHNHQKYLPKHIQENVKRNNMQNSQIHENGVVVIASENAAEPCEIVHQPEGASETTSLDSSCAYSSSSSPVDDSVVLRDTAAILQELALQRLSGGVGSETPLKNNRRRYHSDVPAATVTATRTETTETTSDRRSLDSGIGREIVRERKIRQEFENARGKSEESSANNVIQYLPPCLRARHARSTRAALSRSLDEDKFNRMTGESALSSKQTSDDGQHNSTPNVGTELSLSSLRNNEKLKSRNLGGLDLGDPRCRERIEKYKEERRMFLRDKYRSESFRGTASRNEDDGEQALLARLKQRASRPSLH